MRVYILMATYYYRHDDGIPDSVSDCVGAFTSKVKLEKYKKVIEDSDPMIRCWVKESTLNNPIY